MVRLDAQNLTKRYSRDKTALNKFSYTFTEGIYGLLGPNGAGKSTLIHLLTGNLLPDEGAVFYNKKNVYTMENAYKKRLGYMPQTQALYRGFTLERFLYYIAGLKGIKKGLIKEQVDVLLERVNLKDVKKQRLSTFSGGMLQRALLAQALLGDPKIIILDEPTAGLDPKERIRLRNVIAEIAFDKVVLIATHVVSDIEYIAKNVILLKQGEILRSDSPGNLSKEMMGKVYELTVKQPMVDQICTQYKVVNLIKVEDEVKVRILSEKVPEEFSYQTVPPTLEDLYLDCFDEESIYDKKNV